jgi:hypothetical protein
MIRRRRLRDEHPPPATDGTCDADIAVRAAAVRAGEARRRLHDAQAREPGVRAREAATSRELARNGLSELLGEALRAHRGRTT